MNHRVFTAIPVFAAAAALALLSSCSPKAGEQIVLQVGNESVTLGEYESFYLKNDHSGTNPSASSLEERERFLDLLTRYKLKLRYARDMNLFTDSLVLAELKEYRTSLASTFLIEKEIVEPGIRRLYDRQGEEIRAKHILISVKPDASPADTLAAYNKARTLIREIAGGASFDSMVYAHSEDQTVKTNGGDLYWFGGGVMVLPFEDAAFAMKTGDFSLYPVRSPFGYHILKITARQPVKGTVKVRHIMSLAKKSAADTGDTVGALARITAWQDSLAKGADFATLALAVSEDFGSKEKAGELPWFKRKRYVQPFDEAAFNLAVGEVSPIVKTPYGYHIIKCDSIMPYPSYASRRAEPGDPLKKEYQQVRFNDEYKRYIDALMKEYDYSFHQGTFSSFLGVVDSMANTGDSAWDARITPEIRQAQLIKANQVVYSVDTIIAIMQDHPEFQNTILRRREMAEALRRMSEGFLMEAKSAGLEQRNPEFGTLMKDYTDGIVLYRAEQMEVWDNTSVTDSALRAYFDAHMSDFMFPAKVKMGEMIFESDTLGLLLYDSLMRGADFHELAKHHHLEDSIAALGGVRDFQPANENGLTEMAAKMKVGDISEPTMVGDYVMIIKLLDLQPAVQKSFEEAGSELANAYQEAESKRLETAWLDRVKLKHPVVQHKEVLKEAFTPPQSDRAEQPDQAAQVKRETP